MVEVFFPEPSQSLQTPKDGQNIEKNVNETNQMLQPSLHSMWQFKEVFMYLYFYIIINKILHLIMFELHTYIFF